MTVYIDRPYGLCKLELKKDDLVLLDKHLHTLVQLQGQQFTLYRPIHDQFKELARNAYLQGVLDGLDAHRTITADNRHAS